MYNSKVSELEFGNIILCNFSNSSPAYYDGPTIKNLYSGIHPALFINFHTNPEGKCFILVCPMSDEMKYAELDKELVKVSRKDIENSALKQDLHTINCKMLISVSSMQVTCPKQQGMLLEEKLNSVSKKIYTHLEKVYENTIAEIK